MRAIVPWPVQFVLFFALALALVLPSEAQTSRYGTWQSAGEDAGTPSATSTTNDRIQQLLERLRSLVDEADKARAADRRFLRDLRDLIRAYDWPWRVELLSEDFTDARVAATPEWRITAGEFKVEWGLGLHSVVHQAARDAKPPEKKSADKEQDLAAALLGALLDQAANRQGKGNAAAKQPERIDHAQVEVRTRVTNSFAIDLELSTREPQGRVELGVFQRQPEGPGYTLALSPGARPSVELLRSGRRGVSVVDAYTEAFSMRRDEPVAIQWTRDANGEMVVSLDGKEVLRSFDRGLRDPFDGFSVTNRGGDFALRELTISGTK